MVITISAMRALCYCLPSNEVVANLQKGRNNSLRQHQNICAIICSDTDNAARD